MKLEVKEIKKSFEGKEVLHGVSFQVESGKALGLLGRNGAGKTTTIRIIMDVFRADKGEILLDGKPFEVSKYQIGYLPEERGLYPKKTVIEQMVYLARLHGMGTKEAKESAMKWLSRLGVEEYALRKLETLSKGNQQKVQLASTLVFNPKIIVLDEPFSGLDPVNSQILKEVVAELISEQRIVVFSSHQMNYVEEFCENIAVINQGEVVLDGNLKEIKKVYGKDRLMLSAENYNNDELENVCQKEFKAYFTVCNKKKECIVLELVEGVTKKDVMKALMESKIEIEHFGNYEPSLSDIFVEKVGEAE